MQEIETVWNENDVSSKRASGTFRETIVHERPAGDPRYRGGVSRVTKLDTVKGHHIGTVHEIVMPNGSIPHQHPKDYTLRDCSRVLVLSA